MADLFPDIKDRFIIYRTNEKEATEAVIVLICQGCGSLVKVGLLTEHVDFHNAGLE